MRLQFEGGEEIDVSHDPLGCGISGCAYLSTDGKKVAKIYHPRVWNAKGFESILDNLLVDFNIVNGHPDRESFFAWPERKITKRDGQKVLGILIPKAEGKPISWYIRPRTWERRVDENERGPGWHQRITIVYRLTKAMQWMHFSGLCHSDLSPFNIYADLKSGATTLIDCDGLVVPGKAPPQVEGTPWCRAPEIVTNGVRPSIDTDRHSLAVMIYWILFMRNPFKGPKYLNDDPEQEDLLAQGKEALYIEHPLDKSNRPKNFYLPSASQLVTKKVNDLFIDAFVTNLRNPKGRPSTAEWESALKRMSDRVMPCVNRNCRMRSYVVNDNFSFICPSCGTPYVHKSELIPLLNLYRPGGRAGHFRPDGWNILAFDKKAILDYHATINVSPGHNGKREAVARVNFYKNSWFFENLKIQEARILTANGSTLLQVGKSVELVDGVRLLLGDIDSGRLLYVQMVKYKRRP